MVMVRANHMEHVEKGLAMRLTSFVPAVNLARLNPPTNATRFISGRMTSMSWRRGYARSESWRTDIWSSTMDGLWAGSVSFLNPPVPRPGSFEEALLAEGLILGKPRLFKWR